MMLLVLIYHYLFSGNAHAVSSILKMMCINKELIGWKNVNSTLDTSLCKEPLPLNRSGETPLEVARKAGYHEEIIQVYEAFGLPTTIRPSVKLSSFSGDGISALMDSSDKNFDGFDDDVSVSCSGSTYSA